MSGIEQWDLTSKVSPFLDRHMMFPLLEYLDSLIANKTMTSYSSKDVAAARLSLLRPTHMVDYASDIYKEVHDGQAVPKEMEDQKLKVYSDLEDLRKGCKVLEDLVQNQEERVRLMLLSLLLYCYIVI
jgi:translation initiation factor 3 subunit E